MAGAARGWAARRLGVDGLEPGPPAHQHGVWFARDSIAAMNAAVIWAALALASRRRRRAWSMATQSGLERRGSGFGGWQAGAAASRALKAQCCRLSTSAISSSLAGPWRIGR